MLIRIFDVRKTYNQNILDKRFGTAYYLNLNYVYKINQSINQAGLLH